MLMSRAAYHKKLIPVMSGKSKNKFNRLGDCATDPSITSILAATVNEVKSRNRKLNRMGTKAVVFKNISTSKINLIGSCASKLSVPLGANVVIKIYWAETQQTATKKLICKIEISFLKITRDIPINPLINKYIIANVDDNVMLMKNVSKLVIKINIAMSVEAYNKKIIRQPNR